MGPGWFIPLTSLGFGISSIGTAFVHTEAQASGVRFILGVFEAGMLPGIAYYMSRWYRRSELAFRLAMCTKLPHQFRGRRWASRTFCLETLLTFKLFKTLSWRH